jgi:hypothetical protein
VRAVRVRARALARASFFAAKTTGSPPPTRCRARGLPMLPTPMIAVVNLTPFRATIRQTSLPPRPGDRIPEPVVRDPSGMLLEWSLGHPRCSCSDGSASATCSTACWTRRARATAACWRCTASPALARPRSSTMRLRRERTSASPARSASMGRSSSRSRRSSSSARRASTSSSACPIPSAMPSRSRSG